jgi:hypothetical protein
MTRIHVIVGNETLSAMLDDTPAGRDFAALLPLELSLGDYHATEKVADLPRKLDTTDAPASYTPEAGDITYTPPGAISRSSTSRSGAPEVWSASVHSTNPLALC